MTGQPDDLKTYGPDDDDEYAPNPYDRDIPANPHSDADDDAPAEPAKPSKPVKPRAASRVPANEDASSPGFQAPSGTPSVASKPIDPQDQPAPVRVAAASSAGDDDRFAEFDRYAQEAHDRAQRALQPAQKPAAPPQPKAQAQPSDDRFSEFDHYADEAQQRVQQQTSEAQKEAPSDAVRQFIYHRASENLASIPAGLRSLYEMATLTPVAQRQKDYDDTVRGLTYQITDPKAQAMEDLYQQNKGWMKLNPLSWPAQIIGAGATVASKAAPAAYQPEVAADLDVLGNAAAFGVPVGKTVIPAAAPYARAVGSVLAEHGQDYVTGAALGALGHEGVGAGVAFGRAALDSMKAAAKVYKQQSSIPKVYPPGEGPGWVTPSGVIRSLSGAAGAQAAMAPLSEAIPTSGPNWDSRVKRHRDADTGQFTKDPDQ